MIVQIILSILGGLYIILSILFYCAIYSENFPVKSEKEKTKADILNAGSGISYSNLEIAHIFSKVLDKDLKCVLLDKVKECDSPVWKADVTHILQKYNFKSNFTLEKGLLYYKIYQDEHFTRYTGI
jgi:UDP-glucose 4-epimerase